MKTIVAETRIEAPVATVFAVVSDIRRMKEALPHVVDLQFVSEQQHGVGTRFVETRLMKGREQSCELEVTELVDNDHVRMVNETHGTIWDSVFSVTELDGGGTKLTLAMDAHTKKIIPRIINCLIRGMITKFVAADLKCIKDYCEADSGRSSLR